MTLKYADAVRNAELDAIESYGGVSAILKLWTGAVPANAAAADAGTAVVTCNLPSDWMANASGGVKSMSGSWAGTAAAAGTATYFRIYKSDGTTVILQGTCSGTGGGGDMVINNPTFAAGQSFSVTTFTITNNNG